MSATDWSLSRWRCLRLTAKTRYQFCLGSENPHRLVSLWDIVNQFKMGEIIFALHDVEVLQTACECRITADGPGPVRPEFLKDVKRCVSRLKKVCRGTSGFDRAYGKLLLTEVALKKNALTESSSISTELRNVLEAMQWELFSHKFLLVDGDRENYLDQSALFGPKVYTAFPSARKDIEESGNCLAAECATAAVFHLIRAAEHGLRAMARDRRIRLPKKAVLALATWEKLLEKLEDAEQAIQNYPKTLAREAQYEFYHGAMMQCRRFKNRFRNRVMHTREDYDRDEAHSAFVHVREFMKTLASRISETRRTPLVWKGAKWTTIEP